jgi:hypothetical protein
MLLDPYILCSWKSFVVVAHCLYWFYAQCLASLHLDIFTVYCSSGPELTWINEAPKAYILSSIHSQGCAYFKDSMVCIVL